MSSISFIYVLHLAAFHQADVSPYLYTLLVDSVALVAVLTLVFHSNCQVHYEDKNWETDLLDYKKQARYYNRAAASINSQDIVFILGKRDGYHTRPGDL